jgi:Rieske Fe-S protein
MKGEISRRDFLFTSTKLAVTVTFIDLMTCSCTDGGNIQGRLHADIEMVNGELAFDLAKPAFSPLRRVGAGVRIDVEKGKKPLIVTRLSDHELAAFSSECTHAGFGVMLPVNGVLSCESGHGGTYDMRGRVLTGPPKASLKQYDARIEGSVVLVRYTG